MLQATDVPFTVVVRCRGANPREQELGKLRFPARVDTGYKSVACSSMRVHLVDPDATASFGSLFSASGEDLHFSKFLRGGQLGNGELRSYEFHHVFGTSATNAEVYERTTAPLVLAVREGYNGTCFAYGMTGAGKTHTMLGSPTQRGISGLAAEDLFCPFESDLNSEFSSVPSVTASYLEIYNEKLRDLLAQPTSEKTSHKAGPSRDLEIVEDPEKGIIVPHAVELPLCTARDLELLLDRGNEHRTMASTASNVVSSRSHAILTLTVRRRPLNQKGVCLQGKLCLVDLAGSERASMEFTKEKQERRQEGANINRSLLALGNCITTLGSIANASKQAAASAPFSGNEPERAPPHIPYRDSKLTRLLQESLGGNTRTVMIGCISESCVCFEETLSTLKYASRAKAITRRVHRNTVAEMHNATGPEVDMNELVVKLRDDVRCLRTQLTVAESTNRRLGLCQMNTEREFSEQRAASEKRPLWDPARSESPADVQLEMIKKLRAQLLELNMNRTQAKRTSRAQTRIFSPSPAEQHDKRSAHFDPERQIDEFLFH